MGPFLLRTDRPGVHLIAGARGLNLRACAVPEIAVLPHAAFQLLRGDVLRAEPGQVQGGLAPGVRAADAGAARYVSRP